MTLSLSHNLPVKTVRVSKPKQNFPFPLSEEFPHCDPWIKDL